MVSVSTYALIVAVIFIVMQIGCMFFFERFGAKAKGRNALLEEDFNYQLSHRLVMDRELVDKINKGLIQGIETLPFVSLWHKRVCDYIADYRSYSGDEQLVDSKSYVEANTDENGDPIMTNSTVAEDPDFLPSQDKSKSKKILH